MGRLFRIALVIGAMATAYAGVRYALAWQRERREKNVFPASEASLLLQPARRLIMPVGRTLRRFNVRPGQTVLEVGPGPGYYTIGAATLVQGGRIVCLDIQRGMLDILYGRLLEHGIANVDLIVADATRLPLKDDCADTAFLVTVLGEVPSPEDALGELHRVLRPGGSLGFSESFGDPDYVRAGTLREMCDGAGFREAGHWRGLTGYTGRFVTTS